MKYDPEIHHRRSIRSQNYDYSQAGAYFITLCAHDRQCLFGKIMPDLVGATGRSPTPPDITPGIAGATSRSPLPSTGITPGNARATGRSPLHQPPGTNNPPVQQPEMVLNELGRIVWSEWIKSAEIRAEIELDEFVIMPNHFHAIVKIHDLGRGDRPVALPPGHDAPRGEGDRPVAPTANGPKSKSIAALMAGFKSAVTTQINILRNTPGKPVWQRNYYEHIIRNEKSLDQIREYIMTNPIHWVEDQLYNGCQHPDLV